jgi:cytochrome c biogenesis protein CcmG/thiol:disulfide interchange protein DsbE
MMRRSLLVVLLSVAAVVPLACSDDGGDDDDTSPTTTSGDGVDIDDAVFAGLSAEGLGDGAPPIEFDGLTGLPTVVNFWAPSCVPCRLEMPALQSVHLAAGDAVNFVGINVNDRVDDALAFAAEMGVTYLLGNDSGGGLFVDAGATVLPTTFVLDADGAVVRQFTGEITAEELADAITEETGTEVVLG